MSDSTEKQKHFEHGVAFLILAFGVPIVLVWWVGAIAITVNLCRWIING